MHTIVEKSKTQQWPSEYNTSMSFTGNTSWGGCSAHKDSLFFGHFLHTILKVLMFITSPLFQWIVLGVCVCVGGRHTWHIQAHQMTFRRGLALELGMGAWAQLSHMEALPGRATHCGCRGLQKHPVPALRGVRPFSSLMVSVGHCSILPQISISLCSNQLKLGYLN